MPTFTLLSSLPGVEGEALTLSADGTTQTITIRLTDNLLRLGEQAPQLALTARYDAPNGIVTLAGTFASPVKLLGGLAELSSLELRLKVQVSPTGEGAAATDLPGWVTATGCVDLVGEGIAALGAPDGKIRLALSYRLDPGRSGFALSLEHTPLQLPHAYITVQSLQVSTQLLPEERAALLTLEGGAQLEQGLRQKIVGVFEKIFGPNSAPKLDPAFRVSQRLDLDGQGLPKLPLKPPTLTLRAPRLGEAPPLPGLPKNVLASLGEPQFSFQLLPLDSLNLNFALRNSTLRFPRLAGLEALSLTGHLHYSAGLNPDEWGFSFEPLANDGIVLPDILRFFLEQLSWLQGHLPGLDEIGELIPLSWDEYALYQNLRGLLPTKPEANLDRYITDQLLPTFSLICDGAIGLGFAAERVYNLAFRALAELGADLFTELWKLWFKLPEAMDRLSALLLATLEQLDPADFYTLLGALLAQKELDLRRLINDLLSIGAEQPERIERLLRLWLPTVVLATKHVDAERLAQALLDVLLAAGGALAAPRTPGELGLKLDLELRLPSLRLPAGVWLAGLGLEAVVIHANLRDELLSFPATQAFFRGAVEPLVQLVRRLFVQGSLPPIDSALALRLLQALVSNAEGDDRAELLLLQLGRIFPLGILFALTAAISNLLTKSMPWWSLLFQPIEDNANLKVLRLPAPRSGEKPIKYLIFSDIHRDDTSDRLPRFEIGSIDHFLSNQTLYCELLDYAYDKGYTVLEAGDCEELWFIRDFGAYVSPADKIDQIVADHKPVYERLAKLHGEGRYYRLYGNHDSYLRRPEVFERLKRHFPAAPGFDGVQREFTIYDYFIIDDVKTMMDHDLGDLLKDVWTGVGASKEKIRTALTKMAEGRLGLDSTPYTVTKPLIITHGHQWDFWNCDPNNLAGKLIANSVAVPLDGLEDPLVDLGGIAFNGSPLIDFANGIATLPVLNNFPSYQPARAFAARMQGKADKTRVLIDDHMYTESLPALISYLAMPLNRRENGQIVRWADQPKNLSNLDELRKHLHNSLCIGHTHYPQSQPYFNVEKLLLGPLADLLNLIREAAADHLFGFTPTLNIKTQYFNSGTAGWMEGVIWALEVSAAGQARLVYWTRDTRPERPQTMDWELQPMDPEVRRELDARIEQVAAYLERQVELLAASFGELTGALGAGLPLDLLIAVAGEVELQPLVEPPRAGRSADEFLEQVRAQVSQVGMVLIQVVGQLLRRAATGQSHAGRGYTLTVPLPPELAGQLTRIEAALGGLPGVPSDRLRPLACAWLLGSGGTQLIGDVFGKLSQLPARPQQKYPVLWSLLSLVPLLPAAGLGAPLSASVDYANDSLTLTITLQ